MAYVDLNPVRAGMADTPEQSEYTSIRERLHPRFDLSRAIADQTECGDLLNFNTPLKPLSPFQNEQKNESKSAIQLDFREYLALLDWTGRIIHDDKRGHIRKAKPPILDRLQVSANQWRRNATQFEALHPRRFNRIAPQLDTG